MFGTGEKEPILIDSLAKPNLLLLSMPLVLHTVLMALLPPRRSP
jgi:hypothetical protein